MYKKEVLKNGLRLITIPLKNSRSVTILILVATGSKYETKEINGISHFLEHMFFKGTKKRPTVRDISETLDKIGGEYNAFTSKDVTGVWAKVATPYMETALDWAADILLNSKFEEKEIEKEKGVIIEELNMYLDTPASYVTDLFEELLYKNQPAGWKIIGEKENILNLNREKIVKYWNEHYTSENTVICIAGSFKPALIKKKVMKFFKDLKRKPTPSKAEVKEVQTKPEILIHSKNTDQTHLCLGVRAYNIFDKRREALTLLGVILGGGMSSRLFLSVRGENALAYYISSSFEANPDTGYLVTHAGVKNESVHKAVELILKEYRDLKEKKISQGELKKAKDYVKGKLALSLESSDAWASFYASQEILREKILTPEEKIKRIEKVTINDIKKVAEDIFLPQKLNMALIGPFKEEDKKIFEEVLII